MSCAVLQGSIQELDYDIMSTYIHTFPRINKRTNERKNQTKSIDQIDCCSPESEGNELIDTSFVNNKNLRRT